jgi:hypothetical protein
MNQWTLCGAIMGSCPHVGRGGGRGGRGPCWVVVTISVMRLVTVNSADIHQLCIHVCIVHGR